MVRQIRVIFYKEESGRCPTQEWLDSLDRQARARCIALIGQLQRFGHALRHPHSHALQDDIYELRTRIRTVRYRLLYFWHDHTIAVISHGIVKKTDAVPQREIESAIRRKHAFQQNPTLHSQEVF